MESMEIDKESNGSTKRRKENDLELTPVAPEESGEGLPYAPKDWPKPGDVWKWRVGRRVAFNGHFLDRYLYLPRRLCRIEKINPSKKRGFASKLSVERFIKSAFPDADVEAFFASFSWKIPAKVSSTNGNVERHVLQTFEETIENSNSDSQSDGVSCNAGNKKCSSLMVQEENPSVAAMPCDICCSEPRFCRDCCCILCCKSISSKYGGFNYIKCEAPVREGYICGHVAHVDCALRSYMAGTVGGSIGLDVEYYCRRCDAKTDLMPHVLRLLRTCESINSCEQVEKMLSVGICILRGSQKTDAKKLLNRIESAISKLKCGAILEDIWKVEDDVSAISTEQVPSTMVEVTNEQDLLDNRTSSRGSFAMSSYQAETVKLEDEVEKTLYELQKSQAFEFRIAEERLFAQKKYLQNLYQQLERERSELARSTSSTKKPDVLLKAVLERVDQIKQEVAKLKDMEEVAKGFGRTPKSILKELFGLEIDE